MAKAHKKKTLDGPPKQVEVTGSALAVELYHRLKQVPHEKLRKEGRAAMGRLSEQRILAEKQHLAQRARRLCPVYRELTSALRKDPELNSVVQAIDHLGRPDRLCSAYGTFPGVPFLPH
jgi:hypothetical protein